MSEWWHNLDQQAKRVQRQNKQMRVIYLIGLAFAVITAIFLDRTLGLLLVLFFVGLVVVNERLIRKMRKAGYP